MSERVEIRPRLRWSLATALAGAVSLLVAFAAGGVLYVAIGSARENTFDLLLDKTDLGMQLLETRVRGQLDPVMTAATQIGEMIAGGRLEPTNRGAIIATFRGALAARPQATGMIFIDRGGSGRRDGAPAGRCTASQPRATDRVQAGPSSYRAGRPRSVLSRADLGAAAAYGRPQRRRPGPRCRR